MKILFIGCVEFSRILLNTILLDTEAEVTGVVTRYRSDFNSDFCSLDSISAEFKIPFLYADMCTEPELVNWIIERQPDVIYCCGWSWILNSEILKIPSKGVIGYHPAALPYNRGRHPIVWALVLGLSETASTFFFMDEEADSGDIIDQQPMMIMEQDDAYSLYSRLCESAKGQIISITEALSSGSFSRTPQNHKISNTWRKRSAFDGIIDWRMSGKAIFNLVRALNKPYVGADAIVSNIKYKIWRVEYQEECFPNIEPGKVLGIKDQTITIKCGDGIVNLLEHEFPSNIAIGDYL